MRSRTVVFVAALAAITLVAGCGEDSPKADTPTLDIARLDSGNYPTVPRDMETVRYDLSGAGLEAVRIGDLTPLPFEIDGKYSFQRLINVDRRTTRESTPQLYSLTEAEFFDLAPGFVTGWGASAERRDSPSLGSGVGYEILRFESADLATAAARRLAARQAANLPGDAVPLTGFPGAQAKWSPSKKYLDTWTPRNELVLYVHVEDPISEPPESGPLAEFTQEALEKLTEALGGYQPTPVDRLNSLPMDPQGVLGRAMPMEEQHKRDGHDQSLVMPRQAAVHFELQPALAKAAFDDAGVDLVAFAESRVYRARDADSAARLMAAFIAHRSNGWQPIAEPPNMPGVQCFITKEKQPYADRYPPSCFVAYDRFVARVTGKNAQELHQKAAAQYKLLAYKS
ncbi:hypothetical protein AB0H76_36845 [Nocardia sp. NPDC050712]|uniref:DUF7373 family lipoprotein n=1 Tax=Nocardia sp. NPDC050712 TaxID=3155518 RepID=UPI0033C79C33